MGIDRRIFFKTLGVTGVALATGTRLGADVPEMKKQNSRDYFMIPLGVSGAGFVNWSVLKHIIFLYQKVN